MSDRRTMSIPEAGAQMGLGRNASYAAANRGEIPVIRFGRRKFVPRDWVEHVLKEAMAKSKSGLIVLLLAVTAALAGGS